MSSSESGNDHAIRASERTPLLGHSFDLSSSQHDALDGELQAAQVAEQLEGGPAQTPGLPKATNNSHGQLNDRSSDEGIERLVKFGKNGKLEGIGDWKFRCILGGILLGYTVSEY